MKQLSTYLLEHVAPIFEGGAGGHMLHPYLLNWVKTGKDLIRFYESVANNMDDLNASMKIDGVNVSIRMVDGEFVFDRMSPKDIEGIKKDQLVDRFGAGHGLVEMGGLVLDIFNDGIDSCKPELERLGLLDDETVLFNIEYVDKSTNLISYSNSFLAIHGLLKFEVNGKNRATHEVSYDQKTLDKLIEKLNKISAKYGFDVVGSVGIEIKHKPDLNKVLKDSLTINTYSTPQTETIEQWLKGVNEFDVTKYINTFPHGRIGVISHKAYVCCTNVDTPLNQVCKKEQDIPNLINSFVIYEANRRFGDEILRCIDSKIGAGNDNEGIVVRNKSITKTDAPVKITGSFSINIANSRFAK